MATEIITGDWVVKTGDWIQIEDGGTSMSDGAFQQLTTGGKTQIDKADLEGAGFIELLITGFTPALAPDAGLGLSVHIRAMNINAAADDQPVPDSNFSLFRGFIISDAVATAHVLFSDTPIAVFHGDNEIYLENLTQQTINSGYLAYFRPWTGGAKV